MSNKKQPPAKELFWDDLPHESNLHCFNGRIGDLQVRMRIRGTDKERMDLLFKDLMRAVPEVLRKHGVKNRCLRCHKDCGEACRFDGYCSHDCQEAAITW